MKSFQFISKLIFNSIFFCIIPSRKCNQDQAICFSLQSCHWPMLSTTWTVPWQQVHAVPMGIIQPQTLPAATSPVRHTSLPSSQFVLRKLCTTLLTLVAGATWGMWLYKEPSGLFIAVLLWNCQILGNEELKLPLGQCWPPPAQQPRRTKGSRESVPGDAA